MALKNNLAKGTKYTPKKQARPTHQLSDELTNDESSCSVEE